MSDPTSAPRPRGPAPDPEWPGQFFGLPRSGPRSVGGWGRRILALFLDWFLSLLVVGLVTGQNPWAYSHSGSVHETYAFALMAVEIWLFTCLLAGSAGQVIMRIAVVRPQGGTIDPLKALIRTVLLLLVVPPLVFNNDQRGLHDLAAGSIVVRR